MTNSPRSYLSELPFVIIAGCQGTGECLVVEDPEHCQTQQRSTRLLLPISLIDTGQAHRAAPY